MREVVDVVIVGAGPVGVLAANLLGAQGVSVLLVDSNDGIVEIPRAISMDNETLRVVQAAGLADQARRQLPAVPHVEIVSPAGCQARVDAAGSVDGHPRLVAIFQPDVERMFRSGLCRYSNVELRPRCTYVGHQEERDRVIVRLKHEVGHEVEARYLLGCDGAKSAVREACGWALRGSTYEQDWLIVDVARPAQPMDHVEFLCDPRRPTAHVPGPNGAQRWEFMLLRGETRAEMEHPARVAELLRPWGDVATMQVLRTAVYRFHARVADCFGRGRVYLAGDAAHLTPPFAGQGLCAGIRDVANLSWKLAAVLRGDADPRILDTYEQERRPHVSNMLRLAVVLGGMIMPTDRLKAGLRDVILHLLRMTPFGLLETIERLKPRHRFRAGLFVPGRLRGTCLAPGRLFPQHPVRTADERIVWSDDALGPHLVLVGMGVDPSATLTPATRAAWKARGGRFVWLANQQQRLDPAPSDVAVIEDLTGDFHTRFGRNGVIAAVRPDRTVLAVCNRDDAEAVVRDANHRLRPWRDQPALRDRPPPVEETQHVSSHH
jgi:3-(3-hydroxy-phenyl)propionate hydroxylase